MDAYKKFILAYQVSDARAVGTWVLAIRMDFNKLQVFPGKMLKFIADVYRAYLIAIKQF